MKKLFEKYRVEKIDGTTDAKAEYFVLRIDKDPHARVALRAYSRSICKAEPDFAGELMGWADHCEATQQPEEMFGGPDDWFDSALDVIEGASAYRWDRERPYNGQPHTDFGERGRTLVVGLTMRDIADCFAQACLDSCVDQRELSARADRALNRDMYEVELGRIDPGAWQQNLNCRIEKMMGIYPNVPDLVDSETQ